MAHQDVRDLEVPVGPDSGISLRFKDDVVKLREDPSDPACRELLSGGDKIVTFGDAKTPANKNSLGALRDYLKDCETSQVLFMVGVVAKKRPQTMEERKASEKVRLADHSRLAKEDPAKKAKSTLRKSIQRLSQTAERSRQIQDCDTTARSQSRSRLTRGERDQQRLQDAKAHKDKRASMTSKERQAYSAEQQKYDKAYYDSLKATEEGRTKLAKKKNALRERRAGWTEVEKDVERALNLVGKIRKKRTESELQWEMRIVEEVEREADIEAEKRELEYELCKESVELKKNTAALASRIRRPTLGGEGSMLCM